MKLFEVIADKADAARVESVRERFDLLRGCLDTAYIQSSSSSLVDADSGLKCEWYDYAIQADSHHPYHTYAKGMTARQLLIGLVENPTSVTFAAHYRSICHDTVDISERLLHLFNATQAKNDLPPADSPMEV